MEICSWVRNLNCVKTGILSVTDMLQDGPRWSPPSCYYTLVSSSPILCQGWSVWPLVHGREKAYHFWDEVEKTVVSVLCVLSLALSASLRSLTFRKWAVMLKAAGGRGVCGEELKPPASSQQGTKAFPTTPWVSLEADYPAPVKPRDDWSPADNWLHPHERPWLHS